jgi:hypothetical protein
LQTVLATIGGEPIWEKPRSQKRDLGHPLDVWCSSIFDRSVAKWRGLLFNTPLVEIFSTGARLIATEKVERALNSSPIRWYSMH